MPWPKPESGAVRTCHGGPGRCAAVSARPAAGGRFAHRSWSPPSASAFSRDVRRRRDVAASPPGRAARPALPSMWRPRSRRIRPSIDRRTRTAVPRTIASIRMGRWPRSRGARTSAMPPSAQMSPGTPRRAGRTVAGPEAGISPGASSRGRFPSQQGAFAAGAKSGCPSPRRSHSRPCPGSSPLPWTGRAKFLRDGGPGTVPAVLEYKPVRRTGWARAIGALGATWPDPDVNAARNMLTAIGTPCRPRGDIAEVRPRPRLAQVR